MMRLSVLRMRGNRGGVLILRIVKGVGGLMMDINLGVAVGIADLLATE